MPISAAKPAGPPPTGEEVMRQLERLGTEANRVLYQKHGCGPKVFGVGFAHLDALAKRIGKNMELALELWASGNADAQCLATMVADPMQMKAEDLDNWASAIYYHILANLFARNLVLESPFAQSRLDLWIQSKHDFQSQAAWVLVALAANADNGLEDAYFEGYLKEIEERIGLARNYTRHAMNGALIAIGQRNSRLLRLAIDAAERIGVVEVSHGETDDVTPDARHVLGEVAARARKG